MISYKKQIFTKKCKDNNTTAPWCKTSDSDFVTNVLRVTSHSYNKLKDISETERCVCLSGVMGQPHSLRAAIRSQTGGRGAINVLVAIATAISQQKICFCVNEKSMSCHLSVSSPLSIPPLSSSRYSTERNVSLD